MNLTSAIGACFLAAQASASCYQLFDASEAKIYEGSSPPFDISYPGQSAAYDASRARGEYLMILPGNFCEPAYADESASGSAGRYGGRRSAGSGGGGGNPCAGRKILYGPRGGAYCINANGSTRYLSQD